MWTGGVSNGRGSPRLQCRAANKNPFTPFDASYDINALSVVMAAKGQEIIIPWVPRL
jgi:hypothetical protein